MNRNAFFASCLLVLVLLGSAPAKAGEWERLGSRQVNFVGDRDTIAVTAAEGRFNAIRLDVDQGDLEMYNVVVTFGNDERWSPDTRWSFDQGTRSRVIDLPGDARFIRKVEFVYRSKLRKGHAVLTLYGRQADVAAPPPMAPQPAPVVPVPAPRWDRLGERQVKFRGEKDTIVVTAKEGLFDAIKLEINEGDLEMYDLVVTFGDGSKFSPETRFNFGQGSMSRTIDLPGSARFIRKVEFFYRSTLKKGRASLVLWGRHPAG